MLFSGNQGEDLHVIIDKAKEWLSAWFKTYKSG